LFHKEEGRKQHTKRYNDCNDPKNPLSS
jgi:hypothetical protein